MPITPLHLLAGIGLKAALPRQVSFGAFATVNILIDVDSLIGLLQPSGICGASGCAIHGIAHSLLSVTRLALVVYAGFRRQRGALAGALIGGWSHIGLDMFYHPDVLPLAPFTAFSPFYGTLPPVAVDWFCVAIGVLIPAYMWRACKNLRDIKDAWKANP